MKGREGRLGRATLTTRRVSSLIPYARPRPASARFQRIGHLPACRGMTSARTNASVFLDPELIHAGERVRPFGLERVPAIEVAHETVAPENAPITLHHLRGKFKTDKFQVVLD